MTSPVPFGTPRAQAIVSKYHFFPKGIMTLEEWAIPHLGEETHGISLEYLVISEIGLPVKMEVWVDTLCFLTQPKEGQQFENKTKPELTENQTVWKSDNQGFKEETFTQTGRRGGDQQPGRRGLTAMW